MPGTYQERRVRAEHRFAAHAGGESGDVSADSFIVWEGKSVEGWDKLAFRTLPEVRRGLRTLDKADMTATDLIFYLPGRKAASPAYARQSRST